MKFKTKFLLIFFISYLSSYSQRQLSDDKINVFILAGQSNMAGAANASNLSHTDIKDLENAQQNISFVYNGNKTVPLNVTVPADWKKKKFQLDSCFGSEIFFGIELSKKHPNKKFLFITHSVRVFFMSVNDCSNMLLMSRCAAWLTFSSGLAENI